MWLIRLTAKVPALPDDPKGRKYMNVTKVLGFAAVGALLILAAPGVHAQAMSLANPGAAAAVQQDSSVSKAETTQVYWRRGWHRHWHRHWRRHW